MSTSLDTKRDRLLELLSSYRRCAVAFSGGVDSAIVAKAARLSLGDAAVAVTAVSPSLAESELESARDLARLIGIRHVEIQTDEVSNPSYAANAPDRCYHCKSELYTRLSACRDELQVDVVANGSNADDLGDFRPGLRAAGEFAVQSPLADCGLTKQEVRQLAALWELPVADKPASPCLSSRIAYGVEVTPARLRMIEQAEVALRQLGLQNFRVRYHADDLARIEVPAESIAALADGETRAELAAQLKQIGFRFVTLDLEGFRSGSLNQVIPAEELTRFGGK